MSDEIPPDPPDAEIKAAFLNELLLLPIEKILPTKVVSAGTRRSTKFQAILASIKEVGVIEAPVVVPDDEKDGHYVLLDGHMRIEALKELGQKEITCLVSTDDESFTYNKLTCHLPAVQQHAMILNGIKRGMSEEKVARALNVDVGNIRRKRDLLNGISADAVEVLKEKNVSIGAFPVLRKMKPVRQLEAANLMVEANCYLTSFAKSILHATPKDMLVEPEKVRPPKGYSEELLTSMEHEREILDREYRLIIETHDRDVFNLVLAQGWLTKIMRNERIKRHLLQNHPDIYPQFLRIMGINSLDPKQAT